MANQSKHSVARGVDVKLLSLAREVELLTLKNERSSRRERRDELQRISAARRKVLARKLIPKRQREAEILANRYKRVPEYDVEAQAGDTTLTVTAIMGALFGALTAYAGVRAYNKLYQVADSASEIMGTVALVTKYVKAAVVQLKELLGPYLWCIPLVMLFFFVLRMSGAVSVGVSMVLVSLLSTTVGKGVWSTISKFFQDGNGVTAQASGFETAGKIFATIVAFSALGSGVKASTVSELTKRISFCGKAAEGWEKFSTWFMEGLEVVVNYMRNRFGYESIELFQRSAPELFAWAKAVDDVDMQLKIGKESPGPELLNELVRLTAEGHGFKNIYRGTASDRFVCEYHSRIAAILQKFSGALNARNNFRFEPVMICLLGDPGIGKTRIAMALAATILVKSGLLGENVCRELVLANIWQKGTSEFWNGYLHQLCLIMDDAFQQRPDPKDKDSEAINIIRMMSCWAFPLNFADVESKGRWYFGSKIVVATTNVPSIKHDMAQVINEPAAVARRIKYGYKLLLNKRYATAEGFLDNDSFEAERKKAEEGPDDGYNFPWHIWSLIPWDFMEGRAKGPAISVIQMIDTVSADLRARNRNYGEEVESLNRMLGSLGCRSECDEAKAQAGKTLRMSAFQKFSSEPESEIEAESESERPMSLSELKRAFGSEADDERDDTSDYAHSLNSEYMPYIYEHDSEVEDEPDAEVRRTRFRQLVVSVRDTVGYWSKLATSFFKRYKKLLINAAIISVVLVVCGALIKGIRDLFITSKKDKKKERVESQSNVIRQNRERLSADTFSQSGGPVVSQLVYNNTYKMHLSNGGPSVSLIGQVLFVRGTIAVMPLHFLGEAYKEYCSDGQSVEIVFTHVSNPRDSFSVPRKTFESMPRKEYADRDLMVVDFGKSGRRAHRDIVSYFLNEKDQRYLSDKSARLDVCKVDGVKGSVVGVDLSVETRQQIFVLPKLRKANEAVYEGMRVTHVYSYDAPTKQGDCGAPVTLYDANSYSGRCIVGVHVAGKHEKPVGFCNVITRELLDEAFTLMKPIVDNFESDIAVVLQQCGVTIKPSCDPVFEDMGSFQPLAVVSKPIPMCPSTSYYKTALGRAQPLGLSHLAPAPLGPVWRGFSLVRPMVNAVKPYSTPQRGFDRPWAKQAMHVALRPFNTLSTECPRFVLTNEEAVVGIPHLKFRSIPRGTSAGFPLVYTIRDGKREVFGTDQEYDLDNDNARALFERVEHVEEQAKKGVRSAHVFVDFLKDELRSPAKVEAVATRLISSAPLDYTVLWRKYFGCYSAAMMKYNVRSGMAPGMCTYTDWGTLVNMITKRGPAVFDGDFKAFDSSEQPAIHAMILHAINDWYDDGPENARVRAVLWEDLLHSRHIGGDGSNQRHIYQWNKSLPSGHPFTTIVNSIYSLYMLVGTYIHITGDLTGFWDAVSAVTYGDDNVVNVDSKVALVYNQRTVAEAMTSLFGVTYTPSDKSGEFKEVMDLSEISFLKRKFARGCDGDWVCPLELASFLHTAYWCRNKKLEKDIRITVLEEALEELSMHCELTWAAYAPVLIDLLKQDEQMSRAFPNQASYLAVIRSRSDRWY